MEQEIVKTHFEEVVHQATEFWRLNLAELAEQCTLAECDPICLAYGRPEICGRATHV